MPLCFLEFFGRLPFPPRAWLDLEAFLAVSDSSMTPRWRVLPFFHCVALFFPPFLAWVNRGYVASFRVMNEVPLGGSPTPPSLSEGHPVLPSEGPPLFSPNPVFLSRSQSRCPCFPYRWVTKCSSDPFTWSHTSLPLPGGALALVLQSSQGFPCELTRALTPL